MKIEDVPEGWTVTVTSPWIKIEKHDHATCGATHCKEIGAASCPRREVVPEEPAGPIVMDGHVCAEMCEGVKRRDEVIARLERELSEARKLPALMNRCCLCCDCGRCRYDRMTAALQNRAHGR